MAEPGIHRIEVTTLGDLLDLRAAELGEHLAMVFPDHQVTYAGLAERADFFARGLLAADLKPGATVGLRPPTCSAATAALFGAPTPGLPPRAAFFAPGLPAGDLKPGETVGILLPTCADAIAALFGAAKAGLYPVPVNARYKRLELADLIRHSRMRLLFISPPDPVVSGGHGGDQGFVPPGANRASPAAPDFPALLSAAFPALGGQDRTALALDDAPDLRQVVVLGESAPPGFATEADFAAAGAGVPDGDLQRRRQLVKVRDPAVVMYTSGTAAEPKGALLSHEALIRFADGTQQTRFFLTTEDRIWTALPMFHIGGIAFSVATIYAGATLVHTGFFRPELALDQIASMHCTIVLAAFETIWLPVVNQPDFNDRDLSSVRIVMTVGVTERLRDMASRLPDAIQVSCFGMTEA